MNLIINFLDGKKTYVAAIAGAIYGVLISTNVAPNRLGAWTVIISIGVVGVRSVISKWIAVSSVPTGLRDGNDATLSATKSPDSTS